MTPAATQQVPTAISRIFLEPGKLYCSARPVVIRTVLGSCISVCLVDRRRQAAGMNHYVLPKGPDGHANCRYGTIAIEQLVQKMIRLGCSAADLQAKVFGGAAVLPFGVSGDTVGTKNVTIALDLLRQHAIPVVARCTGGENGLVIMLHTASGDVMVRPIARANGNQAILRAASYGSLNGDAAEDSTQSPWIATATQT